MRSKFASILAGCLFSAAMGCSGPVHVPTPDLAAVPPAERANFEKARHAIAADPRSDEAWGEYGMRLRAFGFHQEARPCFAKAEQLDRADPRWPYFLARSPYLNDPDEALRWLRRSVELCGNKPPGPRYYLARTLTEENRWPEAEKEISALLAAHPAFAPALLLQAQLELARTNFAAAEALLQQSAADPRTRQAAAALLAQARQRQDDAAGATAAARRAASLPADAQVADPFEERVLELRADALSLAEQGHRMMAARDLTNAARVASILQQNHPGARESWLVLGLVRLLQGNPPAAEAALRKHLELQPDSAQGLFQLGLAQMSMNQFAAASATFEQALPLKPDFGPAWYNLGFARARSGKLRDAITPFRETIRHNPEHADAYLLLADIYLQLNEPREASNLVSQAALVQPANPRLAVMRQKLGGKK